MSFMKVQLAPFFLSCASRRGHVDSCRTKNVILMALSLALSLSFFWPLEKGCASPAQAITAKNGLLQQLNSKRSMNSEKLAAVDKAINELISAKSSTDLIPRVETLRAQRQELVLRQNLYDHLILATDIHYQGQTDLHQFFTSVLQKLAQREATRGESGLWRIYLLTSQAIESFTEPREDVLEFMESYWDFSTLSHPKPPQKFVASREYTNGRSFETASGVPRDKVGALVDSRLRRIQRMELRTRLPREPSQPIE